MKINNRNKLITGLFLTLVMIFAMLCAFSITAGAVENDASLINEDGYAEITNADTYYVSVSAVAGCADASNHTYILLGATKISEETNYGASISVTVKEFDDGPNSGIVVAFNIEYTCPGCGKSHIAYPVIRIPNFSCEEQYSIDNTSDFNDGDTVTVSVLRRSYNSPNFHDINYTQRVDPVSSEYFHHMTCSRCALSQAEDCGGDENANCTVEGTCTTCGGRYTIPGAHTVSDEWTKTSTEHYRVCENGCGQVTEELGEHTYAEDGYCSVCEYPCSHSYDKNNGTYKCTVCGMACPHNYRYSVCTDCGMECSDHRYEGGICAECGAYCTHDWDHNRYQYYSVCTLCELLCGHNYSETSRMDATCSAEGVVIYKCAFCTSVKYEVLEALDHEYTWTYTDTTHQGYCEVGKETTTGFHEYTQSYTEATCTEDAYYTYTCTVCTYSYTRTSASKLGHTGGTATCISPAICDRCDEPYGELGDHIGGEATCTQKALCDVCGEGYGELSEHIPTEDNDCTTDDCCVECDTVITPGLASHEFDAEHYCTNEGCYATEECVITLNDNGSRTYVTVHYYESYYLDVLPNLNGQSFLGWDEDGDGVADYSGIGLSSYTYIEGPKTFNAVYGSVLLVRYFIIDLDTDQYKMQNAVQVSQNGSLVLEHDYAYWYMPLGWATTPNASEVEYEFGEEITVTETMNLYAVWEPFKVRFDLDGGAWLDADGTSVPESITENTEFYTVPTRLGYKFLYFACVDQYGSEFTQSFYVDDETGDVSLYISISGMSTYTAVWEKCTHDVAHGECSCGVENFSFYGQSLNIGGDLSIKYYVTAYGEDVNTESLTMEFFFLGKRTEVKGAYDSELLMYVFTLEGIDPQCMGDAIDAVLLLNGVEKAAKNGYSVEENLNNLLEKYSSDEKLVTLINDLLAYGKASESYTGHSSTDGNYVVRESYVTTESTSLEDSSAEVDLHSVSVRFGTMNYLVFKFSFADGVTPRELDVTIDGKAPADAYLDGEFYVVISKPISPEGFYRDLVVTCDYESIEVRFSINDYCAMVLSDKRGDEGAYSAEAEALARTLYNYGMSAHVFKDGHSGGEGTATCAHIKICDDCGVYYCDLAPDKHLSDVYIYEDNNDGTHKKIHECGFVADKAEEHTFDDDECVCGNIRINVIDMSVDQLNTAMIEMISEGNKNITVNLPEDASSEMFSAISDAIKYSERMGNGGVHLAIAGASEIPSQAFMFCKGLASVQISISVRSIGEMAFYNCENLKVVTFATGGALESIGKMAFDGTGIETVTIPATVAKLGERAFQYCMELREVIFEENSRVTIIEYETFYFCKKLTSFVIPESVMVLEYQAFCDSGLTSIVIPNTVTSIDGAFVNCAYLTEVTFEEGCQITELGANTFTRTGIVSIVIPESVKTMKRFAGCGSLESVTLLANEVVYIESSMFQNSESLTTIYVPAELVDDYKASEMWSDYSDMIRAIPA